MLAARFVAERLERGAPLLPFAGLLARGWAIVAGRHLARPLDLTPLVCPVIAVGGTTLGGSGKTPLVDAIARHLAACGARVTIIGHAHRADPRVARVVTPDDEARAVGDEALALVRGFVRDEVDVRVVVARSRAEAIAFAGPGADVAILDGVGQTSPVRAALALLAVDAHAPFGAGRAPPAGDLRASPEALVAAADLVVRILDPCQRPPPALVPSVSARLVSRGAQLTDGTILPWASLAQTRLGLVTCLARPARITRFLAARGVHPLVSLASSDHEAPGDRLCRTARAQARRRGLDLWLCTPKCAVHLRNSPDAGLLGASLAVIDHALKPDRELGSALALLHPANPLS